MDVLKAGRTPGPRPPLVPAAARELVRLARARAAVLVEGWSDQAALETLAQRRGIDLVAERVIVLPIGGVTNIGQFVETLGPRGLGLRLGGLYDLAEEQHIRRGLARAGAWSAAGPGAGTQHTRDDDAGEDLARADLEGLGFFACDADLEDELIRALGTSAVERLIDAEGELDSFRRFQEQPAQRARDLHAQLHRFMGTRSGRKVRYGALLADALDTARVPRALDDVLNHVRA